MNSCHRGRPLTINRDGVTDDTAAIQRAMDDQYRCAPGTCSSSTTSPAVVYFPGGIYIISSSIIDNYYTQMIGNPNHLPVLKATAGFSGLGLIDGDRYEPGNAAGVLQFSGKAARDVRVSETYADGRKLSMFSGDRLETL